MAGNSLKVILRALLLLVWMVLFASQLAATPAGGRCQVVHISLANGQAHLSADCHCCDEEVAAPTCGECKPQKKQKSECQCQSSSGEDPNLPVALRKPGLERSSVLLPPVVIDWLCRMDGPAEVVLVAYLGVPPPLPDLNPNRFRGPPILA